MLTGSVDSAKNTTNRNVLMCMVNTNCFIKPNAMWAIHIVDWHKLLAMDILSTIEN